MLAFILALFALVAYAAPQQGSCPFCEFIIQTAEGYILNNATEQEILNFLGQACDALPSPYSGLCKQELLTNGPQIIQWIANKENPQVICTQLHFCSTTAFSRKALQASCGICELVVSYAENFLASNGTVAGLEYYLNQVCNNLPSPFGSECTSFVDQYLPQLVQWLVAMEPPELFCTQVGLCSSDRKKEPVQGQRF